MEMRYGYNRVIATSTYPLDEETTTAIKADPEQILGKAVTLTGTTRPEVGYGESGNILKGIVISVEREYTNSETYVVAVAYIGQFEDVVSAGMTPAVVGKGVAVDGKGSIITSDTFTNAICESKDSANHCVITIG